MKNPLRMFQLLVLVLPLLATNNAFAAATSGPAVTAPEAKATNCKDKYNKHAKKVDDFCRKSSGVVKYYQQVADHCAFAANPTKGKGKSATATSLDGLDETARDLCKGKEKIKNSWDDGCRNIKSGSGAVGKLETRGEARASQESVKRTVDSGTKSLGEAKGNFTDVEKTADETVRGKGITDFFDKTKRRQETIKSARESVRKSMEEARAFRKSEKAKEFLGNNDYSTSYAFCLKNAEVLKADEQMGKLSKAFEGMQGIRKDSQDMGKEVDRANQDLSNAGSIAETKIANAGDAASMGEVPKEKPASPASEPEKKINPRGSPSADVPKSEPVAEPAAAPKAEPKVAERKVSGIPQAPGSITNGSNAPKAVESPQGRYVYVGNDSEGTPRYQKIDRNTGEYISDTPVYRTGGGWSTRK